MNSFFKILLISAGWLAFLYVIYSVLIYIFIGNDKPVTENISVIKNNDTTTIINSPDSTTTVHYSSSKSPNGSYTSTSSTNIKSTTIR